jgi:hypothetical protein
VDDVVSKLLASASSFVRELSLVGLRSSASLAKFSELRIRALAGESDLVNVRLYSVAAVPGASGVQPADGQSNLLGTGVTFSTGRCSFDVGLDTPFSVDSSKAIRNAASAGAATRRHL